MRPEQFRLEARAWPAATGLFIIPEGIWGAGGNFWLGKNIPWFTCDFPEDGRFQSAMRDPTYPHPRMMRGATPYSISLE